MRYQEGVTHFVIPLTGAPYVITPEGGQYLLPFAVEITGPDDEEYERPPLALLPPRTVPETDYCEVEPMALQWLLTAASRHFYVTNPKASDRLKELRNEFAEGKKRLEREDLPLLIK